MGYFQISVKGLTDYLYDLISPEFPILKRACFDPNMAFDMEVHKDILEFNQDVRSEKWILMYWNGTGIFREVDQPRTFLFKLKDFINKTCIDYKFALAKSSLNFGFYSNDMDLLYNLQESVLFDFPYNFAFSYYTPFPILGDGAVMIKNIQLQGVEKLERPTKGSLAVLTYSGDMQYPVIKFVRDYKLIEEVRLKISDFNEGFEDFYVITPP